jgi:uncharacterized protein YdeI (YjbR/CyaY-like superfamily)
MGMKDKRVDAYIAKSAAFAKPVLTHLRALVHEVCPDVTETIKWGMPFFEYKGVLCNMAAFKAHCSFGFWRRSLIAKGTTNGDAMGDLGRITRLSDLPSKKILAGYIKQAMKLNEEGVKSPTRLKARVKKAEIPMPDYFSAALSRNKKAKNAFEAFSPSHRREYLEWITEAKTEPTRVKRTSEAISWISEGKSRNWKYQP